MKATPIIPGRVYQVRYRQTSMVVMASHGCDAICIALEAFGLCEKVAA
ncbi:hypothetical protein [Castellaniella sp.]|nr:hypothetical protein [Castellaniella sp.]